MIAYAAFDERYWFRTLPPYVSWYICPQYSMYAHYCQFLHNAYNINFLKCFQHIIQQQEPLRYVTWRLSSFA